MLKVSSASSNVPHVAEQSSAFSPQRKKARRVSDPLDTVVRQKTTVCNATPSSELLSNRGSNPLSLLCFALENEMNDKENVPPPAIEEPATTTKRSFDTSNTTNITPKEANKATPAMTIKAITSPDVIISTPAAVAFLDRSNVVSDSQSRIIVAPPRAVASAQLLPVDYHTNLDYKLTSKGPVRISKRSYQPWHVRYQELIAFKEIYGNCRVPQKSISYPSLARWVVYMRAQYKAGKLTNEKIDKLKDIGFEWSADNTRNTEWIENYKELERFQRAHGHLNVLRLQNPALHYWCYMQRCKRAHLAMEFVIKLERLGFDWGIYFDQTLQPVPTGGAFDTNKLIGELQIFYRSHGHVNVPPRFPASPALAQWAYKVSTKDLDTKQNILMNSLGFIWRNEEAASRDVAVMTDSACLSQTMITNNI
jgi:hypothetical protein